MKIDFHAHLFPAKIRTARPSYFEGEPAFRLLYDSPNARMAGVADIIDAMDDAQVDVSVVFGFPWLSAETIRLHNDYILEAVSRFPKRLKGFCCVNVHDPNAPAEVARCLDAGMCGVGNWHSTSRESPRRRWRNLHPSWHCAWSGICR